MEAAYVKAKSSKNGFPHVEEVAQWIVVLNRIRKQLDLRDKLAKMSESLIALSKDEDKGSTEFLQYSNDAQNPGVGKIFKVFGDAHHSIVQKRQAHIDELQRVKEEWKSVEGQEIKNCNSLEEKANRALSDKNYYVGHNDKNNIGPAEEEYKNISSTLVTAIKELDQKMTTNYGNWFKRIAKTETDYLVATAAIATTAATAITETATT